MALMALIADDLPNVNRERLDITWVDSVVKFLLLVAPQGILTEKMSVPVMHDN